MSTKKQWDERLVDALFLYGIALPLTLTQESKSRAVRLGGLVWFVAWFFPIGAVTMPLVLLAIVLSIVMTTWRGDL